MTIDELNEKYIKIPQELKDMKRWVCYALETKETGEITKVPINAITGKKAKCNDPLTWTYFSIAKNGCVKYKCSGLGFMLGDGIFGIDLDNHPDSNGEMLSQEKFDELANEFVNGLSSYSELSQSGLGVHIICKGKLPQGRRRNGNVETYDTGRFFAMTGNTILDVPIQDREKEIIPLWQKYVNVENKKEEYSFSTYIPNENRTQIDLNDREVLQKAYTSKNASSFIALMNGDLSAYDDDHSKADMALCTMLAFWTNKDFRQIDRLFRTSGLMRPKWDEMRGHDTYGNITITKAISNVGNGYIAYEKEEPIIYTNQVQKAPTIEPKVAKTTNTVIENGTESVMNLDEYGNPIFRIKTVFEKFPYTDTGNAERFYAYFGELFKYNLTDKCFMFWTGKVWIKDHENTIVRKYANKFIEILKNESKQISQKIKDNESEDDEDEIESLDKILEACLKNINRVSNKAGKDAMISEFKALYDVPVQSDVFNKDKYLLNTDSGIIDLKTGNVRPFDPSYMQSKSTNVKVSYEEPKLWIKFLHDIFYRGEGRQEDTQEIVDCIQLCLGYSLCGSTREQIMFLLYGGGSNGKSTFTDVVGKMMGDYGDSIASENLMQQRTSNNSAIYSIAKLQGCRFLETGETEEGGRFAEAMVKRLTGGDQISAQFKFGNEFSFRPQFKLWMSTNNRPIIRGTDLGIWRRIFPFPFIRSFTEKEKDKDLPEKLEQELPMILGWAIKGFQRYQLLGGIEMPQCLKPEYKDYKVKMDVITQFIEKNCTVIKGYNTKVSTLFKNYKEWAKDECEYVMKASKVEEEMKKKGFETFIQNEEKFYRGIKLKIDKTTAYVFEDFDEEGDN